MYKPRAKRYVPRRAKRVYKSKTRRYKPIVSTAVRKYVKSTLHSNIENKLWNTYGVNITCPTGSALLAPRNLNLVPLLSQGTGQNTRVGNQIRIRSAVIQGYVNLLPYNVTTNPFMTQKVKMFLVSMKQSEGNTLYDLDKFFQVGTSSAAFQSNLLDMVLKVNTDVFTIHATKQFQIGTSGNSSLTNGTTGQFFDNSRISQYFSFNYGKYLRGPTRYNNNLNSYSTNKNMFLVIQPVCADGQDSTTFTPVEIHYNVEVSYEDA